MTTTKFGSPETDERRHIEATTKRAPSFLKTIVGLSLFPSETLARLLNDKQRPHVSSILITLCIAIFSPLLYQIMRFDFLETQGLSIVALAATLALTALLFVVLEERLLALAQEPLKRNEILALMIYGCTPLIPIVLFFYAVDLYLFGRLTIVTFVLTGVPNAKDPLMGLFPWTHIFGKLLFLHVFYRGLRILRGVSPEGGIIISTASAIPFYLGFCCSILVVELALPGSLRAIKMLATSVFL